MLWEKAVELHYSIRNLLLIGSSRQVFLRDGKIGHVLGIVILQSLDCVSSCASGRPHVQRVAFGDANSVLCMKAVPGVERQAIAVCVAYHETPFVFFAVCGVREMESVAIATVKSVKYYILSAE